MRKILAITLSAIALTCCAPKEYDLCVYGGTASGIVAAHSAAKMGLNVIVIEPSCRIGGMTTGGLGLTDIGNKQVVQGLALKFYRECGRRYGNLENWVFEPKVALEVMEEFADNRHIKIVKGYHLADAATDAGKIGTIMIADEKGDTLQVNAKWFIDASYEGDLMAKAGVSYHTGRDGNDMYGETWNGVYLQPRNHQIPDGVDPFIEPGNPDSGLLWGIENHTPLPDGQADGRIQAYNFRICLTDNPENMIQLSRPENYDSTRYELLVRLFDAQPEKRDINNYFIWSRMPGRKTDINNQGGFSTDMIGMSQGWPEGTWEERKGIWKAHYDYTMGLLWFFQQDSRVPSALQDFIRDWGLPKDEYTECGNWTPQLYVRECRRLVGEYVATQADCEGRATVADGIAQAAYTMDSHNCERVIVPSADGRWMVKNEGNVEVPGGKPYPISYRSITPKREECRNLLVPVCLSASHIAFGSIRMEPVFMCLGQAAGIAASIAHKEGLNAVQDVDFAKIREVFDTNPFMDGSAPDIIMDDTDALVEGDSWWTAHGNGGYGPTFRQGDAAEGSATFRGTASASAKYKIYIYQQRLYEGMNPVTIYELSDGQVITFDASSCIIEGQTSGAWQCIGETTLEKGQELSVKVHGDGGIGYIRADAILLVQK